MNKLYERLDFCNDAEPITDEQIDSVYRKLDNADLALGLIENNPANEYASNFIFEVLNFIDGLGSLDKLEVKGCTKELDLKALRHYAEQSGKLLAFDLIEGGIL